MQTSADVKSRFEEFKGLMKLALPIAVAQAGVALMGFVDTVVVGRTGTSALAAVGLANGLFFFVSGMGMGLMMGLDPLLSQAIGARQGQRARALLWQGAWMALVAGTVLWSLLMLAPGLLELFDVSQEQIPQVREFLLWRGPSVPLTLLFFAQRAYLQSVGRPRPLVVAMVAANVLNLVADVLLVLGGAWLPEGFGALRDVPAMGVKGAALASTLCSALVVGVLGLSVRGVRVEGPPPSVKPVLADVLQAARVGFPIGLHMVAEIGVFALAGVLAAKLGPESISAHQIAISFASLSFTVAVGIGSSGSVRVGWAVGANNPAQARQSGMVAFAGAAGFMSLCAAVFALFPLPLAKLAGAPEEVVPLVVPLLMVSAVFQISDGLQAAGAGVLRGAGHTHFTFVANMVGHYAVGLPLALWLGFGLGLGVVGIWWGLCAGLTAVALALLWRFNRLGASDLRPLEA
ncbi:MATE family efflux transporter [Myxococcaceae bacterium GXIMD 01537]